MRRIDLFRFEDGTITLRQEKLLEYLAPIYIKYDLFRRVLIPLLYGRGKTISLRLLDWLVTNFSKDARIGYIHESELNPGIKYHMSIYASYQTNLDRYKRKNFDPFRRRARVYFTIDGKEHTTTPGQLQFILWSFKHGVYQYCIKHSEMLSRIMNTYITKQKKKKKTKQENETTNLHHIFVYKYKERLEVDFN